MRTFNKQAQAEAFKAVYDDDAYWLKHEIDKGAQINLRIDGSPRGERDEKNEMLDKTIAERVLLLAMNKGEETDCLKYLKYHDVNIKDLIINTILPKQCTIQGDMEVGF